MMKSCMVVICMTLWCHGSTGQPVDPLGPCEDFECPIGQSCVLEDVECVRAPCPPLPVCTDICTLPKDSGPCEAATTNYFWNTETGACEAFLYGGCQGNGNRFRTVQECQDSCVKYVCRLPKDVGPCDAAIRRYFYDTNVELCQRFDFGGCDGNANNFDSLETCQDKCGFGCPAIMCLVPCPLGYQRDEEGCQTCDCVQGGCSDTVCDRGQYCEELFPPCIPEEVCPPVPTCVDCPLVRCRYSCESGYRLGENGCQGCLCNDLCENYHCGWGQGCQVDGDTPHCVARKCPRGEPLQDSDGEDRTCKRGWWWRGRKCPPGYFCNRSSSVCCPRSWNIPI